jgi:HAD superfamily hydrolase (TIGR01490 family)
MEILVR